MYIVVMVVYEARRPLFIIRVYVMGVRFSVSEDMLSNLC
jgi:hypothetical protein